MLLEFLLTLALLITASIALRYGRKAVREFGFRHDIRHRRISYVQKLLALALIILTAILISFLWGLQAHNFVLAASSLFTLFGIAFFAVWSILSNITSGLLIFFLFPYRIDDRIRIVDGDNSAEGNILEMTAFHIIMEDDNGNLLNYPNNVAIQKLIIKIKHRPAPTADQKAPVNPS